MCFLHCGIRLGQRRPWFTQAEAELTKHALALANSDGDAVPLLNPATQCFSIPDIPAQTNRSGRVAQNLIHRLQLSFR